MDRKNFIRQTALLATALAPAGWAKAGGHFSNEQPADPVTIINAGVNGNNTKNLLQRLDTDCLAHKPALTIMMIGTNDMNNGKHVPLAQYKTNLEKLAEQIQGAGSKLLMMTILPFYEPYLLSRHPAEFFQPEGPSGRRKAVNDTIRSVAAAQKAYFFDIGMPFEKVGKIGTEEDSLLRNEANSQKPDGVHPTRNGYRFLALAVSQYLICQNLNAGKIVCLGDSITKGDGSTDKESYPAYLQKLLS